ncbi:MAG: hypothetical protein WD512_06585 [Candidatus Paceibacterota bacterium]
MEIKILGVNSKNNLKSKPQLLIWGGLGLFVFSFIANFAAQIIFPILMGVGVVIGIIGCFQLIISYFQK